MNLGQVSKDRPVHGRAPWPCLGRNTCTTMHITRALLVDYPGTTVVRFRRDRANSERIESSSTYSMAAPHLS